MFTMTAQVAQTCATAAKGKQMGAKDKGGRRRAGADYLKQGPATSLYCVKVMTPERSSLRLDAVLRHGAFASFSEIFAVGTNLTNQYLPFDEATF